MNAILGQFVLSGHVLLWAGLLLLSQASCDTMAPQGSPTPSGSELATLILQTDPFDQWGQFPDASGTIQSNPPHGPMSRVFINDTLAKALNNFTGRLPAGSIIVKENMGTSTLVTEAKLTVMWKVAGFDTANNDWFWANLTPEGDVVVEGKVSSCTACHGGARANDFVFVQKL